MNKQHKPCRWQSKKYIEWVRTLPCSICGQPAEVHHIKGTGHMSGAGLKSPDWATMPLCHSHHAEMHRSPDMWESQFALIVATLGEAINSGHFVEVGK